MNLHDLFNLFMLLFLISKIIILTSGNLFVTVVNTAVKTKEMCSLIEVRFYLKGYCSEQLLHKQDINRAVEG